MCLRAWTESPKRREWLARVEPIVLAPYRETVLTGLERWFTLPAPLRSLALSVLMIALMTWVLMPRATRLFQRWLYPTTK